MYFIQETYIHIFKTCLYCAGLLSLIVSSYLTSDQEIRWESQRALIEYSNYRSIGTNRPEFIDALSFKVTNSSQNSVDQFDNELPEIPLYFFSI